MKVFFVVILLGVVVGLGWYSVKSSQQNQNPVSVSQGEETQGVSTEPEKALQTYTLAQVAEHAGRESCYTIIRGQVYDVTSFIDKHPGGAERVLKTCGIDATEFFEKKHGGQERPEAMLEKLVIGALAQ